MKFCTLILMLLPTFMFGQETRIKTPMDLSLGAFFSPDYTYRTLSSRGSDMGNYIVSYRNSTEIPQYGYTTGMNFIFRIDGKFALDAGVYYSKKGYQTKTYTPVWVTPSNEPDPLLPSDLKYVYDYYYIDLPIKMNYFLLNNRFKFFLAGGISTNIFLVQKTQSSYVTSNGEMISNIYDNFTSYSRFNLAGIVGFGLEYEVTSKLRWRVEPTYRHSIYSIINSPVKGYLSSTGLNVGLVFRFWNIDQHRNKI